jgi:hypothetical protein
MRRRVLFVIAADPRLSARPAEAIRIAAGVSAWQTVQVLVYLHGAAVLLLDPVAAVLVAGEEFGRYLPVLAEQGQPVRVQRAAPELLLLSEPLVPYEAIDAGAFAALLADCHSAVRF